MSLMIAAVVIFLITYALIISEKLDRAMLAIAGALAMVVIGALDPHAAIVQYIDWDTIFLIMGMMILVNITQSTGIFQATAWYLARKAKGNPRHLLILLGLFTAVASAFLDNVTTVLLVVPVTLSLTKLLKLPPLPFLLTEIIASNIGGTATLIGDPPNIMIAGKNPQLTFNDFLYNLAPIAIFILVCVLGLLYWVYRKQLRCQPEHRTLSLSLQPSKAITDRTLLFRSLTVLGLTILGFLSHAALGPSAKPAVIAIAGATVLLLWGVRAHQDTEKVLSQIEWGTIFFFGGLFALVGGLQHVGVITHLTEYLINLTNGDSTKITFLLLWVAGIFSALIDNIPFVNTLIPIVQETAHSLHLVGPELNRIWWAIALGACLGGNGTIIGASANVVVAQLAERAGYRIGYAKFFLIGAPITLLSLAISHVYVYLRYFVGA